MSGFVPTVRTILRCPFPDLPLAVTTLEYPLPPRINFNPGVPSFCLCCVVSRITKNFSGTGTNDKPVVKVPWDFVEVLTKCTISTDDGCWKLCLTCVDPYFAVGSETTAACVLGADLPWASSLLAPLGCPHH